MPDLNNERSTDAIRNPAALQASSSWRRRPTMTVSRGGVSNGRRRRCLPRNLRAASLPFDTEAVGVYADRRLMRAQVGHLLAAEDVMIVAIARTDAATVVTRDFGGFALCGVAIINPWGR